MLRKRCIYNSEQEHECYLRHREKKLKACKERRDKYPKKAYEIRKRWRDKNREHRRLYQIKWRKNNEEKRAFYRHRRRTKRVNAGGSHIFKEWKELKNQYNYICPRCGEKEPFLDQYYVWLTEDHIIPIDKGGSDYIENIQPLCLRCNSIKGLKIIKYKIRV